MTGFILWCVGLTAAVFVVAFIFQLVATGLSLLREMDDGEDAMTGEALQEFLMNELNALPLGATQRNVIDALKAAVAKWHASQIIVERNPEDPNRLDVLVPLSFFGGSPT